MTRRHAGSHFGCKLKLIWISIFQAATTFFPTHTNTQRGIPPEIPFDVDDYDVESFFLLKLITMIMMSRLIQFNISVSIVSNLWNSQLILCFCLFPLHSRALGNSFSSAAAEGNCSFEHNRIEEKKKWKNFFLSFFFLNESEKFRYFFIFWDANGGGERAALVGSRSSVFCILITSFHHHHPSPEAASNNNMKDLLRSPKKSKRGKEINANIKKMEKFAFKAKKKRNESFCFCFHFNTQLPSSQPE